MPRNPRNNKVVRIKKRKNINIGVVIFVIIVVYVAINIGLYFIKPHLSIYEVVEQSLASDTTVTGVVIRDETVYHTDKAGYVNYYLRDGSRIAKNTTVYSIDQNKDIYQMLSDSSGDVSLSSSDVREIKAQIMSFKRGFSESSFKDVYDFKENFSSTLLQLTDQNLLDNMQEILASTGYTSSFNVVTSDATGIITYRTDSLDGLTAEAVNAETFNMDNFTTNNLRSTDITEANSAVYKLVTSEEWSIVAMLNEELYKTICDRTSMKMTFLSDGLTITAPVSAYQSGSEYYLKISLNKYMVRYIGDRFLEIDLSISTESGLKIPKTAIVEKQFFMVPKDFFTYGGDSDEQGLIKETYDTANGNVEYVFVAADIYYQDETYAYVDMELFDHGTYIYNQDTKERFQVSMVGKLEGAFNINKGYAVFRRIERLYENDAYVIVAKNTKSGLALYDHIALDASTAVESAVIY